MTRLCTAGQVRIGPGQPLAVIAGPCVLESFELGYEVGSKLRDVCGAVGLSYVFKASFDKANRSSINSKRGPGLDLGLDWLAKLREKLATPATTDIHDPSQAARAAEAVDILQIPAFLCRQTDLLLAAGQAAKARGRAVNVKKGQFMSPSEMGGAVRKLADAECSNVMLTERGTFFGYGRLVNDFIGIGDLMELAVEGGAPPVCFDCTHSTQIPGAGEQTGGKPARAPLLARAAVAAGVHAVFLETHPTPAKALSDSSTMLPLAEVPALLRELGAIRRSLAG